MCNQSYVRKLIKVLRDAVIIVTRAFFIMSEAALVVISGIIPLEHDMRIEEIRHNVKRGRVVRIGGHVYDRKRPNSTLIAALKEKQEQVWKQVRESDTGGRTNSTLWHKV